MDHKLLVCGLGKLGLCLAAKLAEKNDTLGYDINKDLVNSLNNRTFTTSEAGLDTLLSHNSGRLKYYSDLSFLPAEELVVYIIVPTPSKADSSFDVKYVYGLIDSLLPHLRSKQTPTHIVLVSTVMPGATHELKEYIAKSLDQPSSQLVTLTYNPEFIALGSVLHDMEYPDVLLLGTSPNPSLLETRAIELIVHSYKDIHKSDPEHHILSYSEAELTKLSINTYLTQKISYANNITILSNALSDCRASAVLNAIGADSRIGKKYLKPGLGFGGPCLPRDTRAFTRLSDECNLPAWMPLAVQKIDRAIYTHHASQISSEVNQHSIKHLIFDGVTYKPGSWLLDDSPTLQLIDEVFAQLGHNVKYSYSDYHEQLISPTINATHPFLLPYDLDNPPSKALLIRCHPGSPTTNYSPIQHLVTYTPLNPSSTSHRRNRIPSQVRTVRKISLPSAESDLFRSHYLQAIRNSHQTIPSEILSRDSDQHTDLHNSIHHMYDNSTTFLQSYAQIIRHALLAVDDQVIPDIIFAQRYPTFRVQYPDNISVYQFHKDSHYNHPLSELNHLFYLDQSSGSSSLHLESKYAEPHQKYSDYRDVSLGKDELIQLNTSRYWHGDLPNLTGTTRYSVDFRLLLNIADANGLQTHSGTRQFTNSSYYRNFNTSTFTFEGS